MPDEVSDGRVWIFGDDIDTDILAPGKYMKGGLEILAAHCLARLCSTNFHNVFALLVVGKAVIKGHYAVHFRA